MTVNFFIYSILCVTACVIVIIYFIRKRISLPAQLFSKALRIENSGNYEEAILAYENALNEIKKTRFHHNLKNKIIEKLSILHTTSTFIADQKFVRVKDDRVR